MNRQNIALSGISMLLIVLNHTIHLGLEYTSDLGLVLPESLVLILSIIQALGSFAVPIFLFISGSFVAYAARGNPPKLTFKFIQSSLIHILFPYLIWSLFFYLTLYINHETQFTVIEYIKHLLVGYPFHFIPLLVFFYLISPILVPLGKKMPGLLIFGILIYQLFLLNIKYPGTLGFSFPNWAGIFEIPIIGGTMADWALCFPLGIIFSLNWEILRPRLLKLKWIIFSLTIISFLLAFLDAYTIISAPIARFIGPIIFLLVIPVIQRNSIPGVRKLENVGKRSYGIYLTHLIILDSLFLIASIFIPSLFKYIVVLIPFVFILGVYIPLSVMTVLSKSRMRKYYRYIFG